MATGLPDRSFDAAMSVDALWMVSNKLAAIKEVSRILKRGSLFAFTTWEPKHINHSALLKRLAFKVIEYGESKDWKTRQLSVYEEIIRNHELLVSEMGKEAADLLASEGREAPRLLPTTPRIFVVAKKV